LSLLQTCSIGLRSGEYCTQQAAPNFPKWRVDRSLGLLQAEISRWRSVLATAHSCAIPLPRESTDS
jgi:hypothetical protein